MGLRRSARRTLLAALLAAGLLTGQRSGALEPVFSTEGIGNREVRVCILLLQATSWENPEPFFLPTLASNRFQRVRNLRPAGWTLVNPLAPPVVTQDIANLWDAGYNGAVTFDGVTATVQNDATGNAAGNDNRYIQPNVGGPNTYLAHCQPRHLRQYGTGGGGGPANVAPLAAVGAPIPQSHPAYWEVPLTSVTVSQLANFDAVFVNTHRNLRFTQEEQILLRQFLDQGGTLFLEDSHGCRVITPPGQETDPTAVDFFLKFQFVDGYPGTVASGGTRNFDGYPLNTGGVSLLGPPSKEVISPNHPLLNSPNPFSPGEPDLLGDVRARDHLILRPTASIYLVEEILRTMNTDANWGNGTGTREPAVAVARIGSGKLVLSGVDMIDDCSQPYEAGTEPTADVVPDIKFMFNLLSWEAGGGGHRRGGAFNQGVGAGTSPRTLTPRFVAWWPQGGPGADFYRPTIEAQAPDANALSWDIHHAMKEPLVAAAGIVYLQYQDNGTYWLLAVDSDPAQDRDSDGFSDDGPVRDLTNAGATFDLLWARSMGSRPILGACVVPITHEQKEVPIDVLLVTQQESATALRVSALHATVDTLTNGTAPVEQPGDPFYNWTPASPNWGGTGAGFTVLDCQGDLEPTRLSPPVVYDDHVFVVGSTSFGYSVAGGGPAVPAGEYAKLFAVRLVFDPGSGSQAGTLTFGYPDLGAAGENSGGLDLTANTALWAAQSALKRVDPVLHHRFAGIAGPNFVASAGAGTTQQFGAASAVAIPTLADPTNLMPTIGLVRDARTGLTTPTVFLNRENGDVWAVSGFPEAMGWRLAGDLQQVADITSIIDENGVTIPTTAVRLRHLQDANGNVEATELLLDPAEWRSRRPFLAIALDYTLAGGRRVQEERLIYPLSRLLRGERHSGYEREPQGVVDLLGWSTGAPMLWDADTLVATSSALWLGVSQPAANYEGGGSQATLGVGETAAGTSTGAPAPYQLRASGPVTFFDAAADAVQVDDTNINNQNAIQWVFDPGIVLPESYYAGAGQEISPNPSPLVRSKFSCYGSAVKFGDAVAVAGQVLAPNGAGVTGGMLVGIDPEPVLSAAVRFGAGPGLRPDLPTYLLTRDPATIPLNPLSSLDLAQPSYQQAASFVVDPRQYTLDYGDGRIHLRAADAHLSRLANPARDADANGFEPFPEVYRAPLYGRRLWLVQDLNRDGLLDGGDPIAWVYVPTPIKWLQAGDRIALTSREFVDEASLAITVAGAAAPLARGTDFFVPDLDRPHLISFNPGFYGGQVVYVTYQDVTGANHRERHRVPPPLPGFSFSPLVAGDRLYVSGTQLGNLVAPAIPAALPGVGTNGGLYALRQTGQDQLFDLDWLGPQDADLWPNFLPTALDATYVRGLPVAGDGELYVTFGLDGAGGPADSDEFVAPLFAIATQELLVTESLRVARVDLDGNTTWQMTGTTERNGAARDNIEEGNNPPSADLLTTLLARPSRAHPLPGDRVLLVDTGGDRVVEVDATGLVVWPINAELGQPDNFLRYLGLYRLGLNRPSDAARFRRTQVVNPGSNYDVDGDGNYTPADRVIKDFTVIADRGNHRLVEVVSHAMPAGAQGSMTYFEPMVWGQTGLGAPWELTARQVLNPATGGWIELPYTDVQAWSPLPGEPNYDAANTNWHHYVIARAEGWDQLLRIDPDPDNNGLVDDNGDGVVDGLVRNLTGLVDDWTLGRLFRGLRGFHRFRIGTQGYLAVIEQDQAAGDGSFAVNVYALNGPAGGVTPTGWSFGQFQYGDEVYDSAGNRSYYERALGDFADATLGLRFDRWFAGGAKQWNPQAVSKLPFQNVLAIVNGAPNSVNQTGSNSEVLLVRFNPSDPPGSPLRTRCERILPDVSTTTTYPAGQAASRRRPTTGTYPVASPVYAAQG